MLQDELPIPSEKVMLAYLVNTAITAASNLFHQLKHLIRVPTRDVRLLRRHRSSFAALTSATTVFTPKCNITFSSASNPAGSCKKIAQVVKALALHDDAVISPP